MDKGAKDKLAGSPGENGGDDVGSKNWRRRQKKEKKNNNIMMMEQGEEE